MTENIERPDLIFTEEDRADAEIAISLGFIEFDFYKRLVRIKNVGEDKEAEEAAKFFEALPDPLKIIMPE